MTIYFDENVSQYYAHAFNSLETTENPRIDVLSTFDVFGQGEPDPDLIPLISKNGGALLTRDTDFKKIKLYYPLVKQHNIGAFWIHGHKKTNKWIEINQLIKAWPEIRQIVLTMRPHYFYEITQQGKLKKMQL